MLIIEIVKLELVGVHIGTMLFIEIENLEFSGGQIEIMLFIKIEKGQSNSNISNISISINSIKTI